MFKRLLPINTQAAGIKKYCFSSSSICENFHNRILSRGSVSLCSGPFSYITMLYGAIEKRAIMLKIYSLYIF